MLTAAEREQLLRRWNDTGADLPAHPGGVAGPTRPDLDRLSDEELDP